MGKGGGRLSHTPKAPEEVVKPILVWLLTEVVTVTLSDGVFQLRVDLNKFSERKAA